MLSSDMREYIQKSARLMGKLITSSSGSNNCEIGKECWWPRMLCFTWAINELSPIFGLCLRMTYAYSSALRKYRSTEYCDGLLLSNNSDISNALPYNTDALDHSCKWNNPLACTMVPLQACEACWGLLANSSRWLLHRYFIGFLIWGWVISPYKLMQLILICN